MSINEPQTCYVISGKSAYENTWLYLAHGSFSWSWCEGAEGAFFFLSQEAAEEIWKKEAPDHPDWERAVAPYTVAVRKLVFHPVKKLLFPARTAQLNASGDVSWSYMHKLSRAIEDNADLDSLEHIFNSISDKQSGEENIRKASMLPATPVLQRYGSGQIPGGYGGAQRVANPGILQTAPIFRMAPFNSQAESTTAAGKAPEYTGNPVNAESVGKKEAGAASDPGPAQAALSDAVSGSASDTKDVAMTAVGTAEKPGHGCAVPEAPVTKTEPVVQDTDRKNREFDIAIPKPEPVQMETHYAPEKSAAQTAHHPVLKTTKPEPQHRAAVQVPESETRRSRQKRSSGKQAQHGTPGIGETLKKFGSSFFRNAYGKQK